MSAAPYLQRIIGKTGIHVVTRLLGIILAALAVQFVINGLAGTPFSRAPSALVFSRCKVRSAKRTVPYAGGGSHATLGHSVAVSDGQIAESGSQMRSTYTSGNHLLDALSGGDRSALADDVEIVTLPSRHWVAPFAGPRHHVDFPIDAVISIVATLRSGDAIEVGTIGCEGFLETDAALESDTARRGSFCQVSGDIARMTLGRFRARMDDNSSFARLMRRSVTATLFSASSWPRAMPSTASRRNARGGCSRRETACAAMLSAHAQRARRFLGMQRASVSWRYSRWKRRRDRAPARDGDDLRPASLRALVRMLRGVQGDVAAGAARPAARDERLTGTPRELMRVALGRGRASARRRPRSTGAA